MESNNKFLFNDSFKKATKLYSNKDALIFGDKQITYDKLDKTSDIVANHLIQKGVKKGDIVAIMTKRSIEMIIGIISILKVGATYLPIDPQYPKDRKKFMLKDSNVQFVITNEEIDEELTLNREIFIVKDNYNTEQKIEKIDIKLHNNDMAYVIYTSGSTGNPKGVIIGQGALMNFINGVTEKIIFDNNKRILAVTTICFDIFVLETLLPLTQGLTIVIADELQQKNPKSLMDLIEKQKINMLQMTPSRMKLLLNYSKYNLKKILSNVDTIMIGGERVEISLIDKIREVSDAKIYNMYGPTETTVWITISNLTLEKKVNIGKEICNTKIYLLDENLHEVRNGNIGELYIAGECLSLGYLNRKSLTEEKFIENPFELGEKMYRTGDLAKRYNNNLICIGRIDNQVKIRGYRVELEEIEKNISELNIVKNIAVIAKTIGENNILIAYVVSNNFEKDQQKIKKEMKKILPEYMIPSIFYNIKEIPLTDNGKIDRNKLKNITDKNDVDTQKNDNSIGAIKTEDRLINVIQKLLDIKIEYITFNSSLEELGVNSLKFIQIIVAIEEEFNIEFGDEDLEMKKFKTIKNIFNYIERLNKDNE